MSDFLAEARIVVRPDTSRFAAELEAQLKAITSKPITIPVVAAASPGATGATGVTGAVQRAQAAATEEVTQSHRAATKATLDHAAADQILGNQTAKLTVAEAAQARANRLSAQSQEQLAAAETVASLKTSALAANRARLAAAGAAVATAERAVLAAVASGNDELIAATRNTLALAQAQKAQFQTAVKATIEANALAAAQQKQAATSALAARGAGSTALAMAGARGATLAASSAFLVGAAAAVFIAKSLKEAVDAEDTFRRSTFLLGDELATQLADRAVGIGEAFAIDDDDVLKFETQIGKILVSVGLTKERTAELSEGVVRLAADMAAFNRVPVEDTLKAIQGGLAGNARSLKRLGVITDEQTVKQIAMTRSGKQNASELTNQEIVLARYALILERAAFQQGAFAAQANSLTAQSQLLSVNFEQLQENIGRGLIPVVAGLTKGLNDAFKALGDITEGTQKFGSSLPVVGDEVEELDVGGLAEDFLRLNVEMVALGPLFAPISLGMKLFGDETEETGKKLTIFDQIAGAVKKSLGALSGALDDVVAGIPSANERASLDLVLSQASGDQNQELALLRQREQRQAAFLDNLLKEPALTQKALDLQKKAAANLDQTRSQIQAILDKQTSDATKAASQANAARGKADQALLEMLGGEQDKARNKILSAQGTPGLADDLRFHLEFRKILKKQKDIVADTVKDAQRKASELRSLTTILISVGLEIKDLRRRQAEAMRAAQQERLERLETGTRLDIELADINENTKKRVKLRQDLIRQLQKEARVLKLTGNTLKENRNEIARIRAEIKAINAEQKGAAQDAGDSNQAARFFFEQLQAQQGFAANLLGNLIPSGQTAGLVGIPSPASAGKAGVSGDIVQAALGARSAAQEGKAATSPSAGQASTTNEILRRILRVLESLNRGAETPEANYGAAMGLAIMTGGGGNLEQQ